MSVRKVKSAPKMFISDREEINAIVKRTMQRISDAVGSTLGPSGRVGLLEAETDGLSNKNTKDGVTVFKSLGSEDTYEQIIIEQVRDAAQKTANDAGDGTTSTTIISAALITELLDYCDKDPRFSPAKIVRIIRKALEKNIVPHIQGAAIKVNEDNQDLLYRVAKVSANGDDDMAGAVIDAFESVGYGESSHVTLQELPGPAGYKVELIDGYPIPVGYEESIGHFHTQFINDQKKLRTVLENPKFLLFDGEVNDLQRFYPILEKAASKYSGQETGVMDPEYQNIVFVAHRFGPQATQEMATMFGVEGAMKIFPLISPMNAVVNSQLNFLLDISAFTGAKVFGLKENVAEGTIEDFGSGMELFESFRFRSNIVGNSDPANIEERAEQLKKQLEAPESEYAKRDLTERLGKLTNGIAMIKIFAGTPGDLRERHDRVEDAVCSVRAAISAGALPGGGRVLLDLCTLIYNLDGTDDEKTVYQEILAPAILSPVVRLFDNAGFNDEEKEEIFQKLRENPELCYDIESGEYGTAMELGLFDATKAVENAITNAVSIAGVMGQLGVISAFPRDAELERKEAQADRNFRRLIKNAKSIKNEANERA